MRVLLIGKGGRESALAWAISRSSLVDELLCAPGNPGIAEVAECVPFAIDDIPGIRELAAAREPGLVVVGPEAPLAAGLADALREDGIRVFGPGRDGAGLESSKSFAKELMLESGIPTATAREFVRSDDAIEFAKSLGGPVVVKADGLAEGKGVTVCSDTGEAITAIKEALEDRRFGESGAKILIEEKLEGPEVSALALFDGKTVVPLEPAQDFKRVFDGDRGPNTGGMGSYSPVPACPPPVYDSIIDRVIQPITAALNSRQIPYNGVIYAGLMLTAEGAKVIEFNCRFGDPETQALLPRLDSDLVEALLACAEGSLDGVKLQWRSDACVCVVAASEGYPGEYATGHPILGLQDAATITKIPVFHAGTALGPSGDVVTSGGRVLGVSAVDEDISSARTRAYEAMGKISFDGMHYRSDIAEGVMMESDDVAS